MNPIRPLRSWFRRIGQSLSNRLLFVMIVTSLLVIVMLMHMVGKGFKNQWRQSVRPHLTQYLDYVNADLGYPPDPARATELANRLPINIYIESPDSSYSSSGQPLDIDDLEFHTDHNSHRRSHKKQSDHILAQANFEVGEHQDRTVLRNNLGDYQVYFELAHHQKRPHHNRVITHILIGFLLIFGTCYLLIRRMLKPVQEIKQGVRLIGDGKLEHRVPVRADNDLGELAGSINQMANDIEQMLDAKRQLLLGVSHELRSPLTRANLAVEMLDSSNNKNRLREDLKEMEQLISEILETERFNSPHAALNLSQVDLVEMINTAVEESNAEVTITVTDDVPGLMLDEPRMKLAIRNLIVNAVRHGQGATIPPSVKVGLSTERTRVSIIVSDFGDGIPDEHLPHIMEPFYRADPSRTRSTGGFGLGLYLCKRVVEAHRGTLAVQSQTAAETVDAKSSKNTETGTRFEISLPINNSPHN